VDPTTLTVSDFASAVALLSGGVGALWLLAALVGGRWN